MAHTTHDGRRPNTGRTHRRALRREVPSTVALLTDETDFAAMRGYRSFAFLDHDAYLRQMEGLLRELAAGGVHTTVALFDPVEYVDFCADSRLDPDSAQSRTRYVAEVAAAGPTVTYQGQPLDRLVSQLIDTAERQATVEYAAALLAHVDDHPDRSGGAAAEAFQHATEVLSVLLEAAGDGVHHLVCSVPVEDGALTAVLHAETVADGAPRLDQADAAVVSTVLAVGIATRRPGGVVLRTSRGNAPDTVRGWGLRDGRLRPLTEAEVFAAYCTDAETGEPIPPEHGVRYRAGFPLAGPEGGSRPGPTD